MRKSALTLAAAVVCATATGSARGVAIENAGAIAEFANYREVYRLNIPTTTPIGGWNTGLSLTGPSGYSINNSGSIAQGSFSRVAYYMELTGATNTTAYKNGWIWVSFDSAGFTDRADRTGVPATTTSEFYQQNVSNMTVYSNIAGIVTGTGITTGNVEFWPSNYTEHNTRAAMNGGPVPNATGDVPANNSGFDWGDAANTGSGHGSMQIHNHDLDGLSNPGTAGQTLLSYGSWGGGGSARTADLGIGNNPGAGQAPDWTLTASAGQSGAWTTRTLQVFVVPEPSSLAAMAVAPVALLRRSRRRLVR